MPSTAWASSASSWSGTIRRSCPGGGPLAGFGGSTGGFARGRGVAADSDNNILITGEFEGSVNFGGGDLPSSGVDLFVAKLAYDGTHASSRRFGDDATQTGAATAADPSGDVLVAGTFKGSMVLGNTTVTANKSGTKDTLFIAKLAR